MTAPNQPILVFGGTFDPPHRGHVEPCRAAADAIGAARIIVMPARISPTKTDTPTAAHHRVAMLQLAFAHEPRATLSTLELDRPGPSFFVETARALRTEHGPDADLRFLVGADHALAFRQWREWETILDLIEPVIVVRPPVDRRDFETALHDYWGADAANWCQALVDAPEVDINATDLRTLLSRGADPAHLVGPDVAAYIAEHQLYRAEKGSDPFSPI